MNFDWDKFTIVAFIDSNVVLECLALEQLPWKELHVSGPILVLVPPTVLQEVDSKKYHFRLSKHAKRFNRTISPLLEDACTVTIRSSPAPLVEMALVNCRRINWELYPDLEPDEADSRVVAQILESDIPQEKEKILLSHDIRPLYLAKRHGLKRFKISEKWLRPKEKSESEKRVAILQNEIESMKSRQPKLNLSFNTNENTVLVHKIHSLSKTERQTIKATIIQQNPMPIQEKNSNILYSPFNDYDHTLSERYSKWKNETLTLFMTEYERKLELNFGQVEIVFCIENIGQVPAESLLIQLSAKGGWLNKRYVLSSPSGPNSPRPTKRTLDNPHLFNNISFTKHSSTDRHEFVLLDELKRSTSVQLVCEDFRHGYSYELRIIGWADPYADEFQLEAIATASNLYGEAKGSHVIAKTTLESSVHDIINIEDLSFHHPPRIMQILRDSKDDFSNIEID